MYFGEGTDNDLDDWASFLEVPDFMTTFANSQVHLHTLMLCALYCDMRLRLSSRTAEESSHGLYSHVDTECACMSITSSSDVFTHNATIRMQTSMAAAVKA